VPVGQDQRQHVEMTRDLAAKFNLAFDKEVLVLPEAYILDAVAVVPGIDGQKMSKSYDNTIEIFLTPKATKKRCAQIVTDSTPLEEPKNPDTCNVFALLKLFAAPDEQAGIAAQYRAGGYGYGHAKARLGDLINETFDAARQRYDKLIADPGYITDVLREGGRKARNVAEATMQRVRDAAGIVVHP
jgi:tryptophanyl-tRNA synthetase